MPKQMLDTVQIRSGFAFVPKTSTDMRWSDDEAEKFDAWLDEHDREEREKERERCARVAESDLFDGDDPRSSDEVAYNTARREAAFAIRSLSNVVDPDDDEEFCDRCLAGVDSNEHHEKCVITGHAEDGESATKPSRTGSDDA